MWPFKKDKVIDLTQSQVKVPASVRARLEGEYKDMASSSSTSSDSSSALGFLGSMASSASSSDNLSSAGEGRDTPQHLKVKIDDVEYKIENMRRRMDAVFDRLDLAEKKIDRLEGR